MPTLDRITIFPVKSLDGMDVDEARVLPSGGLEHDRRWQLVDMEGRVVNAKRTPRCHAIRAEFDLAAAGQEGDPGVAPTGSASRWIPRPCGPPRFPGSAGWPPSIPSRFRSCPGATARAAG